MRTFSNLHDAYHVVHCSHAFIYLFFYGKGVASPFKVLYLALKLIIDLKLIIISLNISIFCLWLFYTLCISHTHTLCICLSLSLSLALSGESDSERFGNEDTAALRRTSPKELSSSREDRVQRLGQTESVPRAD